MFNHKNYKNSMSWPLDNEKKNFLVSVGLIVDTMAFR